MVDHENKPQFEVFFENRNRRFSPQVISAAVLSHLKKSAETYLGHEVVNAVVTIPAYFSNSQRQATKDAAEIAGLTVLRLLNEPSAAALAYGLKGKKSREQNILIYDLGGGTFDVSILTTLGDTYEVKAIGGDSNLGGEDFNNRMLDFFLDEIKSRFTVDISLNKIAIIRLLQECEKAKIALSRSKVAKVRVEKLFDDKTFESSMTRSCFEEINEDFFDKTIQAVESTLEDARFKRSDIDEIVLVGGSTYIPKIQKMLEEYFRGKTLNLCINPDEAVAIGASILASSLNGDIDNDNELVLLDVTPHSLGIAVADERMSKIIEKNTTIPIEHEEPYTTMYDNQTRVSIQVYEGEKNDAKDNELLDSFVLEGIAPAPKRTPKLRVKMTIDSDCILTVKAVNMSNGVSNMVVIADYKNRMKQSEIDNAKKREQDLTKPT